MSDPEVPQRFSTTARLQLRVAGKSYRLSHVSATFIIFHPPVDLPPCEAELLVQFEAEEESPRAIVLPEGAKVTQPKTPIVRQLANQTAQSLQHSQSN